MSELNSSDHGGESAAADGKNDKLPWTTGQVWSFVALPLLGGLTAISTLWAVGHIETKLEVAARQDLRAAGIDPSGLDIDFDYRDGDAVGELPAGVTADAAAAAVDDDLLRNFDVTVTEAVTEAEPVVEHSSTEAPAAGAAESSATNVQIVVQDGVVTVAGTVRSDPQRTRLIDRAGELVGDERVDDQLAVAVADSDDVDDAADSADGAVADLADLIPAMLEADDATAALTDDTLTVTASGDVESGEALEAAVESVSDLDTTVDFTTSDADVETQTELLQTELDALEAEIRGNVAFDEVTTVLGPDAASTLDKVVAAMERYSSPVVDVSGHTDSRGSTDANERLSQERAESVVAYLVEQGIPAERLQATGAGESKPIADNDSAIGQAENRRVEFAALASFN